MNAKERQIFYKEVCDAFTERNMSVKEIAYDYEIATATVYKILKLNNIKATDYENRFNNAIIKDYESGMRTKDIAIKYNKQSAYISYLLRKNKVVKHRIPQVKQKEMYSHIVEMLKQGYTQTDIAKHYNVSKQYISKVYKKFKENNNG